GRGRAAVLSCLGLPMSTTELALRLGMSPPAVSQHLATLRRSGRRPPGGPGAACCTTAAPWRRASSRRTPHPSQRRTTRRRGSPRYWTTTVVGDGLDIPRHSSTGLTEPTCLPAIPPQKASGTHSSAPPGRRTPAYAGSREHYNPGRVTVTL